MSDWAAPMQALRRDDLPGHIDPVLLLIAATLAAFGIVMVASSSIAVAASAPNWRKPSPIGRLAWAKTTCSTGVCWARSRTPR